MPRVEEASSGDHNDSIVVRNPAAPLKRPPPDGDHGRRDAIKRRSARACRTCRARKVRCDITVHGIPCTNCGLDNIDCVLMVSKRGPKPRSNGTKPTHDANPNPNHSANANANANAICTEDEYEDEEQEVAPITPISSSRDLSGTAFREFEPALASSSASNLPAANIQDVAVGLTFDHDDDDGGGTVHRNASDGGNGVERNTPSLHATSYSNAGSSLGTASSAARVESALSLLNGTLPSFIRPLPETMADDDLVFLERKGAFTLPEAEIRDEILRSFVSMVHPFMPILEVRMFLTAVTNNGKAGRIHLLLFQAVMFAGLSALDPQLVRRMGFKTTKHARQIFFARVRLLHDLDIEPDNKSLLQALLLMSLWYGGRNEQRNTWYYTGLALSLAQNMGLHHEPDDSQSEQHLRRRLWWSLYIRDRLIALGTRRPMRIRDDDYEISMLSLQDFDCEPLDESLARFFDRRRSVQDVDPETCLPLMCIELAKLCICIGHVLSSQYTTLGRRSLWTKTLMVVPKQDLEPSAAALELERYDRELAEWYQALHPDVSKVARSSVSERSLCNCTYWHWTVVDMLRLTLISLLHRPQSLRPFPTNATTNTSRSTDLLKASRVKLKAAARELTRLAHRVLHHNQIRYLPTSGVPALLSASLSHLLDSESQDDDVRDASIYRLDQTVQVLKQLREIYASAESAINYLGMVVRKTGISARVSQVAAIAPEFRYKPPYEIQISTAVITTESQYKQRDSTASKHTMAAMLPRLHGQSRPYWDEGVSDFSLSGAGALTHGSQQAIEPTLSTNQVDQNAEVFVRPMSLSAKMTSHAEFGAFPRSLEGQSFGTSSLPGGGTGAVGIHGREGVDRLDQQSVLAYDDCFGPLRNLDYDFDPELFNVGLDFPNDDLLFLGLDGGRT